MSTATETLFDKVCAHAGQTQLLASTCSLLGWDERTKMPAAAGAYRAEQMTLLAQLIHERSTDAEYGDALGELTGDLASQDPHSDRATTIRELRRAYEKQVKLPARLVEELTRASVLGQQSWEQARSKDDFASFQPHLENIVALLREKADAIGYEDCRYDALLDDYEPYEKTANVKRVLAGLREDLVPLVREIAESGRSPNLSLLKGHYPAAAQAEVGRAAAASFGFEFDRGRLDETAHPFCCGTGPNDCRLTTRYDEAFFPSAFFGTLHEAGHGIYDQGLRTDQYGLPPGEAAGLGIHESQSRMWENQVGRSGPFWKHFFPKLQQAFPKALDNCSQEDFFFAINDVRPSLIRVEADEATYNLHIMIRFELEMDLLDEQLQVADLPGAWNDKYREYLGVASDTDADGVLQDIHWSGAALGYFPTYTLGNLYAAQFFAQADQDLGGLDAQFERGEFAPLCGWLREKIHHRGQCFTAAQLVEDVTGQPLSHRPLIDYLRAKLGPLYGIE